MRFPSLESSKSLAFLIATLIVVSAAQTFIVGVGHAYCIDYSQHRHWVSGVTTATTAYGVAYRGGYAYISSDAALQVIDVSDPNTPRIVGSVPIGIGGADIALRGHYAYVADYMTGLVVVDIADPEHPTIAGVTGTHGLAIGLFTKGDYLYLSTAVAGNPRNSQLEIFSIAGDPTSPQVMGMAALPNYGWDVVVNGHYAYVAAVQAGVVTVDVSDPTDPWVTDVTDTPIAAFGVAVSGERLCIADEESFEVASLVRPDAPVLVGNVDLPNASYGIAMYGDYACVADYEGGLQIVDISSMNHPKIVGWEDTPAMSYGVVVSDSRAYVADGNSLQIIELGDDPRDVFAPQTPTPSNVNGVAVRNGYAYIADYTSDLQVMQVSGVATPHLVGSVDTPGVALAVTLNGTRALVADGSSGLVMVDISHPTHPAILGIANTPGVAYYVAVADLDDPVHYAYVGDGASGLQVVDISGNTPTVVGSVNPPGNGEVRWVTVSGQYVFMVDTLIGLVIVDVSNPSHPSIVSTVTIGDEPSGVGVSGTRVFVGGVHGLTTVDVSDVAHPAISGYLPLRQALWPFVTMGRDNLYISQTSDLFIIRISGSSALEVVGEVHTTGGGPEEAFEGDCNLYIADLAGGLQIAPGPSAQGGLFMDVENPTPVGHPLSLLASPNPMIDRTAVSFELPSSASGELDVFDAGGRLVRRIMKEDLTAGPHVVTWDAKDDAGRPAASGSYFLRLRSGGVSLSNRLILLR